MTSPDAPAGALARLRGAWRRWALWFALVLVVVGLLATLVWLGVCRAVTPGFPVLAALAVAGLSLANLLLFAGHRGFAPYRFIQLALLLAFPAVALHDAAPLPGTSGLALWGLLAPATALLSGRAAGSTGWFAGFLLATALTAAGLVDTLKGKGPFTVFAPTDEAFAKVPKADLDALLKDKAKLTAVLTYHVVAGKVMAADVKAGKVKTVQGSELTVTTMGGVKVDNANVVKTDIVADNGVIHVIDSVVIPK